MRRIKTWFTNIVKYIFQTQYKNLLPTLLLSSGKNSYSRNSSKLLMKAVNALNHKAKYAYTEALDIANGTSGKAVCFAQDMLYAAKPQFYYQNFFLTEVKQQQSFVLKLSNAKIFGSSNVVLVCSSKAVYEPFFHDEDKKGDYTDTVISKYVDQSFVLKYRDSKTTIQCGIMLSGNYSWNYYHFIYEFLTKFLLVDKLNLPIDIPLIIDETVNNTPQCQELLNYFNVSDREVIFIRSGYSYDVGTLYYPSLLNIIPPNFKNFDDIRYSDCLFNLNSINFLRDTLVPKMVATNSRKRIFLSRQNASSRRRYNESEVVTVFEKYDFEIVCPENYSVAEQMYLFNNASIIAGVSGAAFTNILLCNHGCKILCITPSQSELSIFSTIAKHLELELQYLSANEKQFKAQSLHEEFVIDPNRVETVLADFINR